MIGIMNGFFEMSAGLRVHFSIFTFQFSLFNLKFTHLPDDQQPFIDDRN
jgi:hypothetical protein